MKKTIIAVALVMAASTAWAEPYGYVRERAYQDRVLWGGAVHRDQLNWSDQLYLDRVRAENHQHDLEIEQIRAQVAIEQIRAQAAIEIANQLRQSGDCQDPRLDRYINKITEE